REVMAVPGSVLYGQNRGAHALIKDGATPVEDAADILEALGIGWGEVSGGDLSPFQTNSLQAALEAAGPDGIDVEGLVRATGLDAGALLAALTALEIDGRVERLTGGKYSAAGGKQ
ncbi:MAG: DNA-protecting protein DprA, partial [Acidobacteria bacterium]|nr:DNA-protecting protein DprA [Acidobacteriota bacterium]